MENKKQLIIIPPMSEALKKLNEVLEGISGDENVEISMIDDLRELSQFIATTGQCLILASNAKKCATFLQDNKAMLAKHHCKTILFTPKEIPAKTLVKFTKIGLTESILENSPPKTFLYKVKLLLRSIKTAKPQDDAEKSVKSLEAGKSLIEETSDHEIKDKLTAEENVIDMETGKKKKNDENIETVDYGTSFKGKIKSQEETIDTNWKSDKKKNAEVEYTEEENMTAESDLESIDMYYRGKNKKIDNLLDPVEDEFGKIKKFDTAEIEEASSRKSNYADVIDEGSMKQKRFDVDETQAPDEDKKSLVELELLAAAKKKNQDNDDLSDLGLSLKSKRTEDVVEAAKTRNVDLEDLGGYLKGNVTKTLGEDLAPEAQAEKDYDNSEIEKDESPADYDLDLLAADKKAKKKDNEETLDDNTHEGEVDQIDTNMIGTEGTVDKIRTRMNGLSDPDAMPKEEAGSELSYNGKKSKLNEDQQDDGKNEDDSLDLESASKKERESQAALEEEDEEMDLRKAQTNLDLLPGDKDRNTEESSATDDKDRQSSALIEKLKEEKDRKSQESDEDLDLNYRSSDGSGLKDTSDGNQTHDGQVEKIDKFYRSGQSKKTEQNWDNLTDKKTTLELLPGKAKTSGMTTEAAASKDYGETTIDYRKLKEEFDMMSSGSSSVDSGAFRSINDTSISNNDDDGSFKVVEIDPKALDFSISIINSIYNKDIKAKQIFAMITDELVDNYHCYPVFYTYKLSDKKFSDAIISLNEIKAPRMTD